MGEKLYTIGQMAKICNMSTEQLRHYDKNNVLSPLARGGTNNYRYYTERQIEDALLIKELKRVGLPLKTIAELVQDKNLEMIKYTLESNMLIQRRALYEHQKTYDSLVDKLLTVNNALSLISQAETSADSSQNYSIVSIAERPIISTRYRSSCSVDDPFIYRYAELLNMIEREKITTSKSLFLLFHDHYRRQFEGKDTLGDLELFCNITGSVKNTENYRMFGGFLAACATHIGHYRYTKEVYEGLMRWATDIGHSASGISFQEVIIGRTTTDNEKNFVTKIYLPLDIADI